MSSPSTSLKKQPSTDSSSVDSDEYEKLNFNTQESEDSDGSNEKGSNQKYSNNDLIQVIHHLQHKIKDKTKMITELEVDKRQLEKELQLKNDRIQSFETEKESHWNSIKHAITEIESSENVMFYFQSDLVAQLENEIKELKLEMENRELMDSLKLKKPKKSHKKELKVIYMTETEKWKKENRDLKESNHQVQLFTHRLEMQKEKLIEKLEKREKTIEKMELAMLEMEKKLTKDEAQEEENKAIDKEFDDYITATYDVLLQELKQIISSKFDSKDYEISIISAQIQGVSEEVKSQLDSREKQIKKLKEDISWNNWKIRQLQQLIEKLKDEKFGQYKKSEDSDDIPSSSYTGRFNEQKCLKKEATELRNKLNVADNQVQMILDFNEELREKTAMEHLEEVEKLKTEIENLNATIRLLQQW